MREKNSESRQNKLFLSTSVNLARYARPLFAVSRDRFLSSFDFSKSIRDTRKNARTQTNGGAMVASAVARRTRNRNLKISGSIPAPVIKAGTTKTRIFHVLTFTVVSVVRNPLETVGPDSCGSVLPLI